MSTTTPTSPLTEQPKFRSSWTQKLSRLVQPFVLLAPAGVWLLLLLVLPALLILELSLIPGFRLGQAAGAYGLGNYFDIFQFTYLQVIGRSIYFALGATTLCLLLGFPVAYWIALMAPKHWRNLLLVAFILPLWTSSLLRAYAWITILRPSGVLNSMLAALHLPTQNWLNQSPAVFIGMAYSFLPYMVLILYASLEKLDTRLLEAAADLGATPQQSFWKITVPQTLPGIAAGCLLVFITSVGDFVVPELLGGASSMTMSRLIYNQFLGATRNWGFGSALSMIMILAVSLAIALLLRYGDRNSSLS
ncbi:ABC transporter permease [Thermocoleostomius sinensis]|uniref:ABC transporter permease n=1 Tax=Thermocoleostomius sinensis A174 TaxID=2016057 RepID=A0A9E8ZFD8_9CYAN|nr:ABC transporter permease [Thermocoleostomius sinensis]WAL62143.1 ABC transporter permease [Thermocoleostomius sinensis A174]